MVISSPVSTPLGSSLMPISSILGLPARRGWSSQAVITSDAAARVFSMSSSSAGSCAMEIPNMLPQIEPLSGLIKSVMMSSLETTIRSMP